MTDTTETKPQSFRGRIKAMAKGPLFYPISVLVGFLEGSFVVVPMEPVFIPMMVMKRKQAWLVALALLLGNVLGGLLIYWLGALLADDVIQPLISMFDAQQSYDETVRKLKEEGFTTLFMIGVTPFPFQVGVAAAGAAGFSVALFVIAVTASRSSRFLVIAFLVMLVGQRAEDVLRQYDVEILFGGLLIFAGFATYLVFFA